MYEIIITGSIVASGNFSGCLTHLGRVRDVSGTRQGRATAMSGLGGGVAHSMS